MSAVTRMPLKILVVWMWVVMVQSECIRNPMIEINKQAKRQYQITDDVLDKMKKTDANKYQNLLRVYGIYRACVESGTQRWTDIGEDGGCPYCRTKIEEEDKITIRPKWPKGQNITTCQEDEFCHVSQQGCLYYGVQASVEECNNIRYTLVIDSPACNADGNGRYRDKEYYTCETCREEEEEVRTHKCPIMCGLCKPPCDFYCKNGGFMEPYKCACSCPDIYLGKECEVDCRFYDYSYCKKYSKEQCGKEVKSTFCPNLCGLCDNYVGPKKFPHE